MPEIAPLRTQLPPKDHKLSDWVRQYGQLIKHSQFLRGFYSEEILSEMTKDARSSEAAEFKVQESVWSELCNAAESGDQAKLHELICNESNHPQLAVANSQFRRIQPKSQYVCKRDQPGENAAHFSLGMSCYTHFTSPIRRYIDIQVHRLVLDLISQGRNANRPSKDQVAKVCRRSTFAQDNSRKFDKACSKVQLAAKLKEKSHETTAVIAMIEKQALSLEIPNQKYNHLSARQRRVQLSDLNLFTFDIGQNGSEIVLTWKLRLYIAPKENIIEEATKEREKVVALLSEGLVGKGEVLNLPAESWQQILKALREGNYKALAMLIRRTERYRQLPPRLPGSNRYSKPYNNSKPEANMEHFYEKKMSLRTFDIVNVQLTAHMTNGVFHPEIQLFKINPSVHICVEHRKYPRDCFATTSRYQASRKKYSSVDKYINAWKPVLAMEAATGAVKESDEFTIHHLMVQWIKEIGESLEGSFNLQKEYCESRQIEFCAGDFVCVHVREDRFMKNTQSGTAATVRSTSQVETNSLNEEELNVTQLAAPSCLANNSRHESRSASPSFWVGHCVIKHVRTKLSNMDTLIVTMDLHQSASVFPEELLNGGGHQSTLSVIHRSLPHRRMFAALCDLRCASQLAHSICMGHEPDQEDFGVLPDSNLSIKCGFKPLNLYQEEAVKEALVKPFTLVLGPPGTVQAELKAPSQVIYCGPSNKSVDVVAKYMLQIPGLKIIRVYGDLREQAEFPIPNKRKHLKISTDDEAQISNKELKAVSLHHIIRSDKCRFASQLQDYESAFKADREEGVRSSDKEVEGYRKLIGEAEDWVLQSSGAQIILCTCATAGSPRIMKSCNNIQQCIVDECGMCLEPESLVPITCSGAQQVVLIGDHKQLQPVIQDHVAKTLGLGVSMFERLSKRAKMLELQYRMQKDICKFPSNYFYEGKLKTDTSVPTRDPRLQSFWPTNVPMAFCHVEGEEESSAIKTAQSNEQSKANEKEVRKVEHVARCLVHKNGVRASDVVILSPYREQRSRISAALQGVFKCKEIPVTTIAKSQGNKNLLIHHPMWQNLIEFYEKNNCLVDESNWPRN
ncbi:helicase [Desmophyllum pertusum]|uniref:Helicase n=1 Tax=Desmophyllum pertusum TaxID=174260 RepID=A0A9X0CWQ9_9CNID|nr:helicase [Desmophyllum pertusum]